MKVYLDADILWNHGSHKKSGRNLFGMPLPGIVQQKLK
jgi:hypothetical protein